MKAGEKYLVDTNVLLDASSPRRPLHQPAYSLFEIAPARGWQLFSCGQIFREYLVVATRPLENNGLGLSAIEAVSNISAFSSRLQFLEETKDVSRSLRRLVSSYSCHGKMIHDANLVALAASYQLQGLVTANINDFKRFEFTVHDLATIDLI